MKMRFKLASSRWYDERGFKDQEGYWFWIRNIDPRGLERKWLSLEEGEECYGIAPDYLAVGQQIYVDHGYFGGVLLKDTRVISAKKA